MSDPLPFPSDPSVVLRDHGEKWMQRVGVKGVGLAVRDNVLKFVILANDVDAVRDVPAMIAGYPTSVELHGRPRGGR